MINRREVLKTGVVAAVGSTLIGGTAFAQNNSKTLFRAALEKAAAKNMLIYDMLAGSGILTTRLIATMRILMRRGVGRIPSVKRYTMTTLYIPPTVMRTWEKLGKYPNKVNNGNIQILEMSQEDHDYIVHDLDICPVDECQDHYAPDKYLCVGLDLQNFTLEEIAKGDIDSDYPYGIQLGSF